MTKGKKKKLKVFVEKSSEERAYAELFRMRFKDLKKAVVARGMPFEEVLNSGHPNLASWFVNHYNKPQNIDFLVEFDNYQEKILKDRGHKNGEAMMSPSFRLSYSKGIEDVKEIKVIPNPNKMEIPIIEKKEEPKIKRELDTATGVMKGTKKNLTFQLAKKGKSLEKIIKEVLKQFPDANEKSIGIWAKKALK